MASQSATTFEPGEGEDDYLLHGSESYAAPSYDGRSSWFAYEDAIDDWCDITELDADKRDRH